MIAQKPSNKYRKTGRKETEEIGLEIDVVLEKVDLLFGKEAVSTFAEMNEISIQQTCSLKNWQTVNRYVLT